MMSYRSNDVNFTQSGLVFLSTFNENTVRDGLPIFTTAHALSDNDIENTETWQRTHLRGKLARLARCPTSARRASRIYFLCTRNLTPEWPLRRSVSFGRNQATQCSLTLPRESESTPRDAAQLSLPAWSVTRPKTTQTPCFTPISHAVGGSSSRSASGTV